MQRRTPHKPGADTRQFRPDVIETYLPQGDTTLLPFLIESMPQRKRTSIKELLKHNQVAINNIPTTQFDTEIHSGDIVKVNLTREFRLFYHRRIKLVYEDDDIIVINKGYGLLSMGTDKVKEGTAYSIVRDYIKWQDPRNKLFIVHRLDRDTSGLMMFAKNEQAKDTMQHNWNNMVLNRKYLAVVEGKVGQESGSVRSYLAETSQYEVYSTQNPAHLKVSQYTLVVSIFRRQQERPPGQRERRRRNSLAVRQPVNPLYSFYKGDAFDFDQIVECGSSANAS